MKGKQGMMVICAGVLIIIGALYAKWDGEQRQQEMIYRFNSMVETSEVQEVPEETAAEVRIDSAGAKTEVEEMLENALGIIVIPKIGLEAAISQGVDAKSLKYAVGHFEDTVMPGEKGNSAFAGHRSYTYNQFFNRLDELKIGDEIIVKTKNGEFKYIVYHEEIVEPTDFSVLDNTKKPIITLITCHPARSDSYRLIVKGRLE